MQSPSVFIHITSFAGVVYKPYVNDSGLIIGLSVVPVVMHPLQLSKGLLSIFLSILPKKLPKVPFQKPL